MSKLLNGLLILSFSLLGVCNLLVAQAEPPQSQTQQPSAQPNSTEADKLLEEGFQLKKQGTKEAKEQALDKFQQSLKLYQALDNKLGQANAFFGIGTIYSDLGELQKALEYYNQALPLFEALNNKLGQAETLNNIGVVYDYLSDYQPELNYYKESLHFFQALGDKQGEAGALDNIGLVYDELGDNQQGLNYHKQALPFFQALGDNLELAKTFLNISVAYFLLGEKQQALYYLNQALPLYHAVGDKSGEAKTLNNIGFVYNDSGEKQKALNYYNQALPILRAVNNRTEEARILNNIGEVYSDLGEKQKALDYYNQALPLSRAVGNRTEEANTLYNLAYLQRSQNNLEQALTNINTAIDIVEKLRTNIVNPDLRTFYFATVQDYYRLKIDLLMQLDKEKPNQGYNIQALETSESARARGLLDLLTEAKANIKQGAPAQLLETESQIQQQLNALEKQQLELRNKNQLVPKEITEKIEQLNQQYQENKDQIRLTSPRYANLTQPKPLKLTEIQQLLDDDTIILEYSLGKDQSYLWLVTKNSFSSYELPKKAEIEQLVKEYRKFLAYHSDNLEQIKSNKIDLERTGTKLLQIPLTPVTAQLKNKRLVIVADGALQLIPFGALPFSDSKQPLLVSNEVINLPSASTLALLREERQSAPKTVAVLADPVFSLDDPRLKQVPPINTAQPDLSTEISQRSARENNIKLKPLPYTKDEAETIMKLVSPEQEKIALDFEANLANATNPELVNYRIIHFATHGFINTDKPELSYLVFSRFNTQGESENGYLRLGDIFNLKLGADLVVLSACETGLGKEMQGEGLVGLTRGFMYAGAPRVVVSLWEVNDQATSILMGKFYEGILKQGLTPSQSLRQAQQELRKDPKYEAPYYWAPFILQGEWK